MRTALQRGLDICFAWLCIVSAIGLIYNPPSSRFDIFMTVIGAGLYFIVRNRGSRSHTLLIFRFSTGTVFGLVIAGATLAAWMFYQVLRMSLVQIGSFGAEEMSISTVFALILPAGVSLILYTSAVISLYYKYRSGNQ